MAVKVNSPYWDKRATARLTEAEKQSEVHIKRVKKAYDKGQRNIQKEIDAIYKTYGRKTGLDRQTLETLLSRSETDKYWKTLEGKGLKEYVQKNYKARITRLEQLKAQLYEKSKEIAVDEYNISTDGYRRTVNQTYNYTMYDTAKGTGFDFGFNTIDNQGIDAILKHNWSGKHYSERIWRNTDILADSLGEILTGAIMSGQSKEKTAREIKELMGVSKYQAERLIRTETNYFNNEAEAEAYEELEVEEYVYVATLDNKTSELCQHHDQLRYKMKDRKVGVNYPPLHPNCRSTVRAWLGSDYEPIRRRARNPETGKTYHVGNMSYKEWAEKHGVVDLPKPVKIEQPVVLRDIKDSVQKFSLSGIDKDYAVHVKDEFDKVFSKYPIDLSSTSIGTHKSQNNLGFASIGVTAKYDPKIGEYQLGYVDRLSLEKQTHKDKATSMSTHERVKNVYGKPYTGDNGTIWHEYAHQIDYKYAMSKHPELTEKARNIKALSKDVSYIKEIGKFNDIFKSDPTGSTMSYELNERLYSKLAQDNPAYDRNKYTEDIAKSFGKYATTNVKEFLAEGFTTMNLVDPTLHDRVTIEFKKLFDDMYTKQLGGK